MSAGFAGKHKYLQSKTRNGVRLINHIIRCAPMADLVVVIVLK